MKFIATPRTLSQWRCFPKLEQYMYNRRNINAILSVPLMETALFPERFALASKYSETDYTE